MKGKRMRKSTPVVASISPVNQLPVKERNAPVLVTDKNYATLKDAMSTEGVAKAGIISRYMNQEFAVDGKWAGVMVAKEACERCAGIEGMICKIPLQDPLVRGRVCAGCKGAGMKCVFVSL